MNWMPLLTLAFFTSFLIGCGSHVTNTADRVFINGAVYTVEMDYGWAEAVAVKDGIITYVGDSKGVEQFIGDNTKVTNLKGQMLLPGFHDSHTHVLIGILTKEKCNLMRIDSVEAVYEKLKTCQALEGFGDDKWIIGGGFEDYLWPNAEPHKEELDAFFPDRPVYIESSFGHSAWVNSKALELAGISKETQSSADGVIVRNPQTGEPTGALHDAAMLLVKNKLPKMTMDYKLNSVRASINMVHSFGVTAVIEPGLDAEMIEPLVLLSDAGEFKVRALTSLSTINWQPGAFADEIFSFLEGREQWRRPNLDVNSVKIYMDGVIESNTGALLKPYEDPAHGFGPRFYSQADVNRYFTRFDAMGLQIHVHSIGDAGTRIALNGFEAAIEANGPSDNRHHMTHLQLISDADIPRFAEYNIGASFQPLWSYYDPAAIDLDIPAIGEKRTFDMYPIGSIHRAGGRINGASDYFVTSMNPLLAMEVAITRQNPYNNSGPPLNEKERVDLETIIRAYTINGAYTMGLDDKQGSLKVGKRADFVVLNQNLFDIPVYDISDVYVTLTVFDGETVYEKP
ncbi:MAG: amidohydrolase [Proteobacteria bacterium]|nr:amidohydrolase [Pseudomonadota bacterium]MDA1351245.1 amidohydrolase [Pseudomonadota bacterium]